ncbi:tRNA lysidine(34) synthetase [Clostridium rectalis]|uniref:tRNA lysidine(34) synthetase n=1 Tax=Clostridium rectalis TaxID=2040295 RepID=UPI000F642B5C|nr:tRNA 2-thiocytidine biosynthesis TtcA family protein [Clostridium rectalis]
MIQFERKYNRMFLRDVRDIIEKYKMITPKDKVAVGISGGKDSVFLLFTLKLIQLTAIKDFELIGITIDMDLGMDFSPIKIFCNENNIPLIIEKTNIADVVFTERKEKNPCSLCSKLRKGALIRVAKSNNVNKLALGHNSDDVIETLFMNVLKVGKLGTFHPNIHYKEKDINIIRPLVNIREDFIESFVLQNNFPVIKNLCPEDKKTTREDMKNLLINLEKNYPDAQKKILTSLTNIDLFNLWEQR